MASRPLRTLSAFLVILVPLAFCAARERRARAEDAPGLGFRFEEMARRAGLTAVTVFGGREHNKYLLETTGCGAALLDYDGDGRLDVFLVNGTTLEGFPKGQEPT